MLKNYFKSEFNKNVTTLFTGTVVAQAIPIAISPILSRLYSPDEFGVWALYVSLVMFFSVFSTGRYQFAIMLPKEKKEAINILGLSFIILIIFCLLFSLIIWGFYDVLRLYESFRKIEYWIYFLPVSIFLVSSISILNVWNSRGKKYKNIVESKVSQTTITSIVNIVVGMIKNKLNLKSLYQAIFTKNITPKGITEIGLKGLIGGLIIGQVIGVFVLMTSFARHNFKRLKWINKKEMKASALKHKAFPTINVMHASMDNVQSTGVTLLIMHFFSAYALGLYSYAYRIIQAPLGMIVSSYAQVFFQKSAEMHANGEKLNAFYRKTLKTFILMGLPIFLIFGFFGEEIFGFIFGNEWSESGFYVQLLTPWFFMNFLFSPMGQLPLILNQQKKVFGISIIGNSLILLSIIIGGLIYNSIEVGFILISTTQFFYYSYLIFWFDKITK